MVPHNIRKHCSAFFSKIIINTKLGQTGYAFLLDQSGLIIAHPVKELIFAHNLHTTVGMEDIARKAGAKESGAQAYVFQGVEKLAGFAPVELTGWTVMVTGNRDEQLAPI